MHQIDILTAMNNEITVSWEAADRNQSRTECDVKEVKTSSLLEIETGHLVKIN